jgi:hypothetical protein
MDEGEDDLCARTILSTGRPSVLFARCYVSRRLGWSIEVDFSPRCVG